MLSCSRPARLLPSLAAVSLALLGLVSPPRPACAQTAVLTQNNDNARTGANTAEATLTPASVSGGKFGKLFTITGLNANVNGQALYAPRVPVGGVTHNVLYAYTSDNRDHSPCGLYAYDADTGAALWHTALPPSATYTTAAPVIDPASGTIYALTKTDNDDTGQTFLHAFDLATGAEKTGSPVQVGASAPGTGDGSVNGRVSFDGPATGGRFHANDRPALLLLGGVVYAAFAHNSDSFPYHGWVLGYRYDGVRFTQTAAFCTTPNGGDGGIWMAGKGLTADAAGYLYCSVGNGTFDASARGITAGTDYGMCYLKLRASDLSVADWFAPFDEKARSDQDLDLGNSGLVGIPGTSRLFGGATKFGSGFLLDSASLGRFTPGGPDKVAARLDGLTGSDSVGQNPVSWDAGAARYVYLWAGGSEVEQLRYDPGAGTFSPSGVFKETSGLTSGGSLGVSSAGSGGGILWGVGNDAVVRAFDATDVSKSALWTSGLNPSRDGLGSVGHFQFPTVVGGRVYVPTGARTIAVYGLLTPPSAHTHLLWNNADGKVSLWAVDSQGDHADIAYGPFIEGPGSVWSATALAVGPDGLPHILWSNTDGRTSLWDVDASGNFVTRGTYGPFVEGPGSAWSAKALAVGPDNVPHVLWGNTDGRTSLWNVAPDGRFVTRGTYGPFVEGPGSAWSAKALAVGPDNVPHVLWNNTDRRASLWNVDASGRFATLGTYGPFTEGTGSAWSATALSVGPDNVLHVLWNNTDARASLWNVGASGNFATLGTYGPFIEGPGSVWLAAALSVGPDNVPHVLWDNTDGRASLWNVGADGRFVTLGTYGPFTDGAAGNKWTTTTVSTGP